MKDRRNGIIQLAILVALGAAVLLSLAAPDLEVKIIFHLKTIPF